MKHFKTFAAFLAESNRDEDENALTEGEGAAPAGDAGGVADVGGDAGAGEGSSHSGGDAAYMIGGTPITTVDVLGKFDPKKGFMGKGDFHVPKMLGKLQRRWPCCYGGSKRKRKNQKYYPEKGMKIITSYEDLTEDEKSSLKPVLVYNIPFNKMTEILDSTTIENRRFDRSQFTKYLNGNDERNLELVGLFSEFPTECLAMAVLAFDFAKADDCYICEIQSFKKGYGKELIQKLMKYQKKLWLHADITASESLLDFYRDPDFKFEEYVIPNSKYDCPIHFFYTQDCDEDALRKHIDSQYSSSSLNESLTPNAVKWYHGANENEKFKLRRPAWNRPFFLTDDTEYAAEYSDYGIYEITIADDPEQNILDFDNAADVQKLGWPKVLVDKIQQGKSDLNAIAYDMWILINDPAQKLLQIDDTVEWQAAAEYFDENQDDILPVDSRSHWQDDKDNSYVLKMWSDIAKAGFSGFTHTEFGHRMLALFDITDIASVKKIDMPMNESKNKVTSHPKVIQQKKMSLKVNTVKKADKIVAAKTTAVAEKEHEIEQSRLEKPTEKKVIANQLRCKPSKAPAKRTASQKEVKDFKQPKISMKKISFSKSEAAALKKQDQIVTTRVSDEYREYQLGDLVKAPWGAVYKVVGRRSISSIAQHPYKAELTNEQIEKLKQYDKLAVLTLALQNSEAHGVDK